MKYQEIIDKLNGYGIENSDTEAEIILSYLFGINKANIIFDKERQYDEGKILPVLEKRSEHIPLQHIIGKWYFMGREFYVSPHCLIPRPDTEVLCENAIRELKTGGVWLIYVQAVAVSVFQCLYIVRIFPRCYYAIYQMKR